MLWKYQTDSTSKAEGGVFLEKEGVAELKAMFFKIYNISKLKELLVAWTCNLSRTQEKGEVRTQLNKSFD